MRSARHVWGAAVAVLLGALVGTTAWLTGALAAGPGVDVAWTTVASQAQGTLEGMGVVVGQKFYSFGGYDVAKVDQGDYTPTGRASVYDPATDAWTALSPLPAMNGSGHRGVTHAGIATDGAAIYLAGGYTADATGDAQIFGTREVWRYDPSPGTYTRLPDLPAARAAGGLAVIGGTLHFFGGTNAARDRETPEHWALDLSDLGAGWRARAGLPHPRNHLGTAVIDGRIYVAGGQDGQDETAVSSADLHVYDPATDAWTQLASLPVALSHTVATAIAGRLVVIGGQTSYNRDAADAYAYDPAADAWTALTPLPAPRFAGSLGTIGDSVYYAGGSAAATTYRGTLPFVAPPAGTSTTTAPPAPPAPPVSPVGSGVVTAAAPPVAAEPTPPSPPATTAATGPVASTSTAPPASCRTARAAVTRWQRVVATRSTLLRRDRRVAARHPHARSRQRRVRQRRAALASARSHLTQARRALARCHR